MTDCNSNINNMCDILCPSTIKVVFNCNCESNVKKLYIIQYRLLSRNYIKKRFQNENESIDLTLIKNPCKTCSKDTGYRI